MSNKNEKIASFLYEYIKNKNDEELNRYRYIDLKGQAYITISSILLGIYGFLLNIFFDSFNDIKIMFFFVEVIIIILIFVCFSNIFYVFFVVFKSHIFNKTTTKKDFFYDCFSNNYTLTDIYGSLTMDSLKCYNKNKNKIKVKNLNLNKLRNKMKCLFILILLFSLAIISSKIYNSSNTDNIFKYIKKKGDIKMSPNDDKNTNNKNDEPKLFFTPLPSKNRKLDKVEEGENLSKKDIKKENILLENIKKKKD